MPPSILRPALRGMRPQKHTIFQSTDQNPIRIHIRHTSNATPSRSPKQKPDPLCILFCGSDHFSCASLSALHDLHKARPDLIESIDVLVRPGKPAGRGLRRIAVGPLFHLAHELKLPLHQVDTFTGWTPPLPGRVTDPKTGAVTIHPHPTATHLAHRPHSQFNLLVAVSFGLFVPPRILKLLPYGGLNVHPSLLPDLRGAAPIPWAILAQRPVTGVTLQTLHPTAFDRGVILAQTPVPPGIPVPPDATTASLLATLAPAGAALLVQGLRDGVYATAGVAPNDLGRIALPPTTTAAVAEADLRYAPKITKADLAVDWGHQHRPHDAEGLSAAGLARRFRAVGVGRGLWTYAYSVPLNPRERRLIFEDVEAVQCPQVLREAVRLTLQAKTTTAAAAAAGLDVRDEAVATEVVSPNLGNVVFVGQAGAGPTREFRLPVYMDAESGLEGTSVLIPVRVPYRVVDGEVTMVMDGECDAIRVRRIKVEGNASKEASNALEPFWERNLTVRDIAHMDYAVDVMARRIEP